jgi:hypothetical protein
MLDDCERHREKVEKEAFDTGELISIRSSTRMKLFRIQYVVV